MGEIELDLMQPTRGRSEAHSFLHLVAHYVDPGIENHPGGAPGGENPYKVDVDPEPSLAINGGDVGRVAPCKWPNING